MEAEAPEIALRVRRESVKSGPHSAAAQVQRQHFAPMRILVVDDEPAVRTALERALRLEGYDVELAADGAEALQRLSLHTPDAVVLDVLMPKVDGLEVCRRLRAADDRTPVLMLTARDSIGDRVAGLDAGADDYLVKPFALEELHARLRALLRRASSTESGTLRFSDLTMDTGTREVRRGSRRIELTRPSSCCWSCSCATPGRC